MAHPSPPPSDQPTACNFETADMCPPVRPSDPCGRQFELGLVLAGTLSAGSYVAGVLDFLIEALDVWEKKKCQEKKTCSDPTKWNVPGHDVIIPVISGASGGGINAALFATSILRNFSHIRNYSSSNPTDNPFFETWVRGVNVDDLMCTSDLGDGLDIQSLLNSTRFRDIAEQSLNSSANSSSLHRSFISDPLRILITTTNLRGVPYGMPFQGPSIQGHRMTMHSDYLGFALTGTRNGQGSKPQAQIFDDEIKLTAPSSKHNKNWNTLCLAALATSAFPMLFQARQLTRNYRDYKHRHVGDIQGGTSQYYPIRPLPLATSPECYRYLNVDGGAMNNEPLELTRRVLAGRFGRNPRGGTSATRATVLIDPFPDIIGTKWKYVPDFDDDPVSVAFALLEAWINQARFKPEDIALAHCEDTYSRFMVAPVRKSASSSDHSLASSILGGFGGFLHEAYRMHDYLLGRRNCQQFLRRHLVLDAEHPMFKNHWNGTLRKPIEQGGYGIYRLTRGQQGQGKLHLPIIPLIYGSSVHEEEPSPDWPTHRYRPENLWPLVNKRFNALWFAVLESADVSWIGKTYLGPARRRIRRKMVKKVKSKLLKELKERGLN